MDSMDNSFKENYFSKDKIVDDIEFITLITTTAGIANEYYSKYVNKELCRSSYQTRYRFVLEILQDNLDRF